jgi:hypothetical protein
MTMASNMLTRRAGDVPAGFSRSAISELGIATAIAIVAVGLMSGYAIRQDQFPLGDGMLVYQYFYGAFTQLLQTGEIPRWLPYSSYGTSADLQHLILPYLSFPVMEFFHLVGFRNAWCAFLVVLGLDFWLSSIGVYLLARQFSSRQVAAVATAALIWTTVIDVNVFFSLFALVTTPFAILFLVLCAKRSNPIYLVFAVLVAGLGAFHPVPYFVPYHALAYIVVALTLAATYRPRLFVPANIGFWAWVAVTVVVLIAAAYLALSAIENIKFLAPQRDANLRSSLFDFLHYGGTFGRIKSLEPFIGVSLNGPTPLFYTTAIATVFPLYAVFARWGRDVAALLFLFWFFLLFCWGPNAPVAPLAYYMPGMDYFRHVAYVFVFPKMFAVLLAAAGMQELLDRIRSNDVGVAARARKLFRYAAATMTGISFGIGAWYVFYYQPSVSHTYYEPSLISVVILVLAVSVAGAPLLLAISGLTSPRLLVAGIAALVLLQASVYQLAYTYSVFHVPLRLPEYLKESAPQPFEEQRTTDIASHPRGELYLRLSELAPFRQIPTYPEIFSFLQLDACASGLRTDFIMQGVADLARKQFGSDDAVQRLAELYKSDPHNAFFTLSGCGVSKLQWISAPDTAASTLPDGQAWPEDCADKVLCLEDRLHGRRLTIPWPDGSPPAARSLGSQGIKINSFVFDAVSFSLTATAPGWLIYADAFDPRFSARVDGADVVDWRANFAYKAVHLDPGFHTVEWRFGRNNLRPAVFLAFELISLILTVVVVLTAAAAMEVRTLPRQKTVI